MLMIPIYFNIDIQLIKNKHSKTLFDISFLRKNLNLLTKQNTSELTTMFKSTTKCIQM